MLSCYVPILPMDLNKYTDMTRGNRYAAASEKRRYSRMVRPCFLVLKLDHEQQYDLVLDWTTKDKRKDSDNVFAGVKLLLDAMVESGRLDTDSYKRIRNISHTRSIGRVEGVQITFLPVVAP